MQYATDIPDDAIKRSFCISITPMISDASNISERTATLNLHTVRIPPMIGFHIKSNESGMDVTHFSSRRIWGIQFTLNVRAILSKYASSSGAVGL